MASLPGASIDMFSSFVFVFSVSAMTGCIFYTLFMSKIPIVTLTIVVCCYAHKFNSVYILAYECGQDSRGTSFVTRDTRSNEYWNADEISPELRQNRCFLNMSTQQKLAALQTSTPWQLKCFEFR
jgi:hypothetical protein